MFVNSTKIKASTKLPSLIFVLISPYKRLVFGDLSADFVGFDAATCHFNTSHSGVFSADFDWKLRGLRAEVAVQLS